MIGMNGRSRTTKTQAIGEPCSDNDANCQAGSINTTGRPTVYDGMYIIYTLQKISDNIHSTLARKPVSGAAVNCTSGRHGRSCQRTCTPSVA